MDVTAGEKKLPHFLECNSGVYFCWGGVEAQYLLAFVDEQFSWEKKLNSTLSFSTQVYKMGTVDTKPGLTCDGLASQSWRSSNNLGCLILRKLEISSSSFCAALTTLPRSYNPEFSFRWGRFKEGVQINEIHTFYCSFILSDLNPL